MTAARPSKHAKTPAQPGDEGRWRHDVFVSYASADRARAAAIVDALQRRGLRVWWDRELVAGEAFSPAIEAELDAARVVLVLWSRDSVGRRFVQEEAIHAGDRLLPVLLDDARAPLGFGLASAVDLRSWRGDSLALELDPLVDDVTRMTARAPGSPGSARVPAASVWELARSVYLDLKTRVVLAALAAAGVGVWLLRGTERWRQVDLEWVAAAGLLLGLGWVLLRGARLARSRAWQAAAIAGVGVAALALGAQAWQYYRLPQFAAEAAGVAVARFAGDRLDGTTQRDWLAQLREQRAGHATSATLKPWLEAVDIRPLHRLIADDDGAQRVAGATRALLLLWGREGRRQALTFADLPGFAPQSELALAQPGTVGLGETPAQVLSGTVVVFASSYGAFARGRYDIAGPLLRDLVDALRTEQGGTPTAAGSLLATAHLLLGSTHYLGGCQAGQLDACVQAAEHYQSAREAVDPRGLEGNLFVEASNNLAVVETRLVALANRELRQAGVTSALPDIFETARSTLADAALACDALEPARPLACTFVAYNRAVAAATARQYEEALKLLASGCSEDAWRRHGLDGGASSLPSRCEQQRAYAAAKLGETAATPAQAAQWFAEAARHARQAETRLPTEGAADVRIKLAITQGRSALGARDYARAAALLAPFVQAGDPAGPALAIDLQRDHPNLDGPEITALWLVARTCAGLAPARLSADALPDGLGPSERTYLAAHLRGCHPNPKEE